MKTIDQCEDCEKAFHKSTIIKAEVTNEIRVFGDRAGHDLMIERMEPIHEGHIPDSEKSWI